MDNPHPKYVHLKSPNCPECEKPIGTPSLSRDKIEVSVRCSGKDCDYSIDLFWLGDAAPILN